MYTLEVEPSDNLRVHIFSHFNKMMGWSQLSQYNLQWENYVVNFNDSKPLQIYRVLMSIQRAKQYPFFFSIASKILPRTQK